MTLHLGYYMGKKYIVHTPQDIAGIKIAAAKTAEVRDRLAQVVRPGMTTLELDELAKEYIADTGGTSAFYQYHKFPGQVCISLNDEIVHGFGSPNRRIAYGDLVSFDVGVKYNGCIGDTARTVCVGPLMDEKARLMSITEESLYVGIDAARKNNFVNDIGRAIETFVKKEKLGIVRQFVGHGCGKKLHEPPEVPNYAVRKRGCRLHPGMVLAIEPMITLGTHKVKVLSDKWTAVTADGSLSAHFEHMILITESKPEVLTWQKKKKL
ncbi:MAG: type I methionyl aminopeptidase [Verrucomicrobiota bacterium]|nr:type I methionyl aminopeptidase [Verrucomicrobiota bacterium]